MDEIRPFKGERQPSSTGRESVLDALRSLGGPVTVQALADHLNLHTNTVRFHLMKLVQAGLAVEETGAPAGPGRPRLCYRPAEQAASRDDRLGTLAEYQLLSHILAGYLAANTDDPAAAARAAGRQWGRYLVERPPPFDRPDDEEILTRVGTMLDKLGFQPETHESGEIRLHRCPFREVAERQPGVICSVHLGLVEGAMDELGSGSGETSLEPFVTPQLCIARLALSPRARADAVKTEKGEGPEHLADR